MMNIHKIIRVIVGDRAPARGCPYKERAWQAGAGMEASSVRGRGQAIAPTMDELRIL
jgi:hypothetical protein